MTGRFLSDGVSASDDVSRRPPLRSLIASLVILLCLLFPTPALARTIRVGFYKFAGYQEVSSDGSRSGYGYEFLQEMARYAGWDYEYVGYDLGWAELQKMLDDGQIDILTSARKTPERESSYLFSTEIGTSAGILTVKSGDTRVTVGDYATYDGLRVGMIKDSSINASFSSFAQEKGFSYTPVYFASVDELNNALQSGNGIDAVCTTNLRKPQNEWILDEFDSSNFYVMMNAKDTELQSEVNAAIAQMDLYSPGWRTTLWNKYYTPDTGDEISLTAEEKSYLADVASGTTYSVLISPDDAPYSYFENGEAKGIVPTIFAEVARRSGISFEFVSVANREEYAKALQDDSAQIVADAVFDYDKAEKSGRKLTVSYLDIPISQVSRGDASSSAPTIAEISSGDATYGGQVEIPSDATILNFGSIEECLDAVDTGKADRTYAYPYAIQRWQDEGNGVGLSVMMLPKASVSFALSVSNTEDPRLLSILNKAVVSVRSSYVESATVSELASSNTRLGIIGFLRLNPIWFIVPVLLLAVLGALGIILMSRQRSLKIISEKNEQLNIAVENANEANRAKSRFLSSMSHDMRTPLNGIISFTNFALDEKGDEERKEDLEKIRQSSSILLGLVNDTLELSRIESGKLAFDPDWFELRGLVDDVAVVIREAARERSISFETTLDSSEGMYARIDRLKFQEILLNLLSNAVKYTEPGGTVRLEMTPEGKVEESGVTRYRIVVADNGIGIGDDFLPHVFDPFAQERDSGVGSGTGAGLGLAIVERLVDAMNGSITVESKKGVGTTFTVSLPLEMRKGAPEEKGDETRAADAGKKNAPNDRPLAKVKALVAEDNDLNAEIARRLLEGWGATVTRVKNGAEAVETFKDSSEGDVNVILMDIHMPVMDGLEAARTIRALDRADSRKVIIIAMTADAYENDVRSCLAAGMNSHVAKPIDPQRLLQAIRG